MRAERRELRGRERVHERLRDPQLGRPKRSAILLNLLRYALQIGVRVEGDFLLLSIELREYAPQRRKPRLRKNARRDRPIQHEFGAQTAHLQEPFHGRAAPVDPQRAVRFQRQGDDGEIDVRREPATQAHFFAADEAARRERGEIELCESHGLLELVRMVAREKDPREMRLDRLDCRRTIFVGERRLQRPNLVCETDRFGGVDAVLSLRHKRVHSVSAPRRSERRADRPRPVGRRGA